MGTLTKKGELRGRVGNYVYRKFNGKIVVGTRPDKYNTKSELVKAHRKNFSTAVKFAKSVIYLEELKKYGVQPGLHQAHSVLLLN